MNKRFFATENEPDTGAGSKLEFFTKPDKQIFWVNIYVSIGVFTGTPRAWTTEYLYESKEKANQMAITDDNGPKYIGAYKITLKPKNNA